LVALKELGADISLPDPCTLLSDATPVEYAVLEGKTENVLKLAELGGGAFQDFLVHWVARCGSPEMVMAVHKAYPGHLNIQNVRGRTPLHYAVQENSGAVISTLVQLGSSLEMKDLEGNSPLHLAVESSFMFVERVTSLLRLGANIEAINSKGFTPLLTAVEEGFASAFFALEEAGANLDATDTLGRNALHVYATSRGCPAIAEYLVLVQDISTTSLDNQGLTPMHYAMTEDELFLTFRSLDGHVDTADSKGRTPLHLTGLLPTQNTLHHTLSSRYAQDVAKFLLSLGADPSIRDHSGKTPADLAREHGQFEIAEIIEGANFKV
jgi:ankyrin repeat protein